MFICLLDSLHQLMRRLTETSKVVRFKRGGRALRTTIPRVIADLLGVEPGDTLIWEPREEEGEVVVVLRKAPPTEGAK